MHSRTMLSVAVMLGIMLLGGYWYSHRGVRAPILVYHVISAASTASSSPTVSRELLAAELDYLQANGYETRTLTDAVRAPMRKKTVVLTFDDADESQFALAYPLLQAHHMVATFFPPSSWIGKRGKLTREQLLTLAHAGMEIGGHTETHPHLSLISDDDLVREIRDDKETLEHLLGTPVTAFAYPFGEHDERTDTAVRNAGYTIARAAMPAESITAQGVTFVGASVMTNSFESFRDAL